MGTSSVVERRGPAGALGSLLLAGRIERARGAPPGPSVRFPRFGCTFLFGGSGRYRDERHDVALGPGSLVLVFPGRPHWYGVTTSRGWDELFLVFDGPIFRTAAEQGVLDPARPVVRLGPVASWQRRVDRFRTAPPPAGRTGRDVEALEVLALLTEAMRADDPDDDGDWYARSLAILAADLGETIAPQDVAAEVGMTYSTWRRAFAARAGVPPAAYRLGRRVDTAASLLRSTTLTVREIAALLGFTDEQHLARRFREVHGCTPRTYRARRP